MTNSSVEHQPNSSSDQKTSLRHRPPNPKTAFTHNLSHGSNSNPKQETFKLALTFALGFGFLVNGFVIGGLIMRCLVENPVQLQRTLDFDYTQPYPHALVPIISCPSTNSDQDGVAESGGASSLPLNRKWDVTISLTVPETDHNWKLGVFEVRLDFLSKNGEVTGSAWFPCRLWVKNHPTSYLRTFLKSIPLLGRYTLPTQVMNLTMKGFRGRVPTYCIRVILGEHTVYTSCAGVPQINAATVLIESNLPIFKRILWGWKKTIFCGISMVLFTVQVMVILLYFRPILVLRSMPRECSTTCSAPSNNVASVVCG